MKTQPTSWGNVAGWYDEYLGDPDTYQAKVIWPNLNRIIAASAKKHSNILDLACGQGYFSYLLSMLGHTVTGIDIAAPLIEVAKSKKPEAKVDFLPKFHVAPASKIPVIENKSQDIAICILALQNIKELDQTFSECARVLRAGGKFVFVLNHPSFRIPQHSDWYFDTAKHKQFRTVGKYMQEATIQIDMNPGRTMRTGPHKHMTVSFHRPLQLFVKLLAKHGFAITRLEEWCSHKKTEAGPRKEAEDEARKEIPMFMCIEAQLINS